jgi:hypothetical protein
MRSYRYGPSLSLDGYNVGLNRGKTFVVLLSYRLKPEKP